MDKATNTNAAAAHARYQYRDYWPVLLAGVMFLAIQWPVLKDWWKIWFENESYYSHGVLVPFIAAFMIWVHRAEIIRTKPSGSLWGVALLAVFVVAHVIGLVMGLRVLHGFAFLVCLYGVVLLMFGWRVTRIVFIPILFLITMMPVLTWWLDANTARFQLISAGCATKVLQLTSGLDVTQYGNYIKSPGLPGEHMLLVGSPCSGLRLLISLITFSWFFVYVVRAAWWKKAFLIALSLPLSIFINTFRITMIGYVGFWTDSSEAMASFHDYSGYIGLVLCFAILFGIARLIRLGDMVVGDAPEPGAAEEAGWRKPVGGGKQGTIALAILAVVVVMSQFLTPLYDLPKGRINRADLPIRFGNWEGENQPIDEQTRTILAKGDLVDRLYTDSGPTGREVSVFVDAGADLDAFHDPHLCMPGGGKPITVDRTITISFTKPRSITVKATCLVSSSDEGANIVIYWYMLGDESFPTTPSIGNANRRNKMRDFWEFVSRPWSISDIRKNVRARQFVWYRFATSMYTERPDEVFLKDFIKGFIAHNTHFGAPLLGSAR